MGTKESKQFLELDGRPLFLRSIEAFGQFGATAEIIVVTGASDVERCERYIQEAQCPLVKLVVAGGSERQHSVYEGLKHATSPWVMVHDGVRPFIQQDQIEACYEEMQRSGAAVLAVPVKDTIKVVENRTITDTPDRSALWAIQTPQGFRTEELLRAHEEAVAADFLGTDDSMLIERLGIPVNVAQGSYTNIKITTPEDLNYAEFWIQTHRKETES